jgi:hypothetical protein
MAAWCSEVGSLGGRGESDELSAWGAPGRHKNEKRRLVLEDVSRRLRRSDAVFGLRSQVRKTRDSDVVVELELVGVGA